MTNNKVITVYLDYFGARYYDSELSVWFAAPKRKPNKAPL